MNPLTYCRDKVAAPGSNIYYALRFIKAELADELLPIYALHHELFDIAFNYREHDIALRKLQWWQEELVNLRNGDAKHPVTQALAPIQQKYNLRDDAIFGLWQAAQLLMQPYQLATAKEQEHHFHQSIGLRELMVIQVCSETNEHTIRFSQSLAVALGLCQSLQFLRRDIAKGYCFLSQEDISKSGSSFEYLHQSTANPNVQNLLRTTAQRAQTQLQQAYQELENQDRKALRASLTLATFAEKLLAEFERSNYQLLQSSIDLTPLRKLWLAWRLR